MKLRDWSGVVTALGVAALLLLFSLVALLMTWPTKRRRAHRAERLMEVQERKRAKLEDELNKAAAES